MPALPVSRRGLLSAMATGLPATGLIAAASPANAAEAEAPPPEPPVAPPLATDHGDLPSFKYHFADSRKKETAGGWAREATVAEFPASKALAGVNMRLHAGAYRELHWHALAAEWAFMLSGHARTTVIDPDGNAETNEFGPGDVWYFPRGYGHSIQGLGPDGCEFMLVFDDGAFSEFGTFSVTDWLAHTPPEMLAKNLGVPAAAFAKIPDRELYIMPGTVPPPLPLEPPVGSLVSAPQTHRYPLLGQRPIEAPGGTVRIVSSKEFPVSTTMTGVLEDINPGAVRELHWHPHADEWQYYVSGQGRMTVFGSSARARTWDYRAGDVGYVPRGYGHYIENTGSDPLRVLVVLNSGVYGDISISDWLARNPARLVAEHFNLPLDVVARFPKRKVIIA